MVASTTRSACRRFFTSTVKNMTPAAKPEMAIVGRVE